METFLNAHLIGSVGLLMLVVGFAMLIFPPKWPNIYYGYRTPSSIKNEKNWNLANGLSTRYSIYSGLALIAVEGIGFVFPELLLYPFVKLTVVLLGCTFQIIPIEIELSKNKMAQA